VAQFSNSKKTNKTANKFAKKNHPEQPQTEGLKGLIVSYFGNSVAVEAEDGHVYQCHTRRNQTLPVVGDYVRFEMDKAETGVILGIEPRESYLGRGDGHGNMKAIAANLNTMVIVMAPPPIFSTYLIDRYLIAAELLHINPVIVLNKIDLLSESTKTEVETQLAPYRRIPYPVLTTSIYQTDRLQTLKDYLSDKTSVLVGPSGVGKSSLIRLLTDNQAIIVGDVSAKGTGKHTTTASRLYHLSQSGKLIDSPGVREFNLWPVAPSEVLRSFKEFQPHLSGCKFRNCQHHVEPGCQILAAMAEGDISEERFKSYHLLLKETKDNNPYKK
jgi:ribosome biogenesis GTPase